MTLASPTLRQGPSAARAASGALLAGLGRFAYIRLARFFRFSQSNRFDFLVLRSHHVNDLFKIFFPVVPGRLELPTSTLSV